MVDSAPKRDLRVGPARTKRAEQTDKATKRLRELRASKKRKDNIQEQYKTLSERQLEDDDEGNDDEGNDNEWKDSSNPDQEEFRLDEDNTPVPPPKRKSKASSNAAGKANAQPINRKVALADTPAPSLVNTNADEVTLKSQLIAKIAMCNQRTDHFDFSLKELKMVWENGNTRLASGPTAQASERIAGAFDDEELQDLGTVEVDDSSNMKGTKIRKGPLHKGGSRFTFWSRSRVPSTSTVLLARSSSPGLSRVSSPLVTSSCVSSQYPLEPPTKRGATPITPNAPRGSSLKTHIRASSANTATNKSRGACSASSYVVQSNLTDSIEWDIDSEEEAAECEQIEQDNTTYELGETSCDEDRPKKGGKSKSSNYQGPVWAILEATFDMVFGILLAQGFFNDPKELDELIARTWRFCATRIVDDPTLNRYSISVNKL